MTDPPDDLACPATTHTTQAAYRNGCIHPAAHEAASAVWRRRYVKSRDGAHTLRHPVARARRAAVVERYTRLGWSSREIAADLGVTDRTVVRYRGQLARGELAL